MTTTHRIESKVHDIATELVEDNIEVDDAHEVDKLADELHDEIMGTIEIFLNEHKKARS